MGTCTVTKVTEPYSRHKRPKGSSAQGRDSQGHWVEVTIVPSNSYATGGDTIPLTGLPFKEITAAYMIASTAETSLSGTPANRLINGGNVTPQVIIGSSPKLALIYASGGSQLAGATDMSTRTLRFRLYGKLR